MINRFQSLSYFFQKAQLLMVRKIDKHTVSVMLNLTLPKLRILLLRHGLFTSFPALQNCLKGWSSHSLEVNDSLPNGLPKPK